MFITYCNKCFCDKELQTDLQLYFSQCGHILCAECVIKKCPICNKNFNPILINKDMPQSMAIYFEDPTKMYKRFQKLLKFQFEQQSRYFGYHMNVLPKLLKTDQSRLDGVLKLEASLDEEIAKEKDRLKKLQSYIAFAENCNESNSQKHASLESDTENWPLTPSLSSNNSSVFDSSKEDSGISSNGVEQINDHNNGNSAINSEDDFTLQSL